MIVVAENKARTVVFKRIAIVDVHNASSFGLARLDVRDDHRGGADLYDERESEQEEHARGHAERMRKNSPLGLHFLALMRRASPLLRPLSPLLLLLFVSIFSATSSAATVNWISSSSGSWHDGANWDTGIVPGAGGTHRTPSARRRHRSYGNALLLVTNVPPLRRDCSDQGCLLRLSC